MIHYIGDKKIRKFWLIKQSMNFNKFLFIVVVPKKSVAARARFRSPKPGDRKLWNLTFKIVAINLIEDLL